MSQVNTRHSARGRVWTCRARRILTTAVIGAARNMPMANCAIPVRAMARTAAAVETFGLISTIGRGCNRG